MNKISKPMFLIAVGMILSSCSFSILPRSSIPSKSSEGSTASTSAPSSTGTPSSSSSKGSSSSKTSSSSSSSSSSGKSSIVPSSGPEGDGYHVASDPKFKLIDANNSAGMYPLNSLGNRKMLVVPVQLSDGPAWTQSMLDRVNTAIFGTSEETNYWESVASFFEKSSYGQLHLSGEITDVLKISNYTVSSLNKKGYDAPDDVVIPAFYEKADASLLKDYDQDGDGRVDATLFVYSNNYSTSDGSAYWAWVSYPNNGTSTSKPKISTYFWVSYEFTNEGGTGSSIDAHTFIHECGHILGLDDYYNYDGEYDPAGDKEMQSYNIGDQGMYSKYALGWVNPYVLDDTHADTVTIPLRSSALYPDAILLNDSWNGTPCDEYILIEYYTPEGNNQKDATTKYSGRNLMYTNSGLRIYHVDARLAKLTSKGSFVSYTDEIVDNYACFTGASNTTSLSYLSSNAANFKLLSLMQADVTSGSSKNALKNGGTASTTGTLYTQGKTWSALSGIFPKGANKFNDGSTIGYSVSLDSVVDGVAQVKITRK